MFKNHSFEVGESVDIKGRDLDYYPQIKEVLSNNAEAVVEIKTINQPDRRNGCKECGCFSGFSMNILDGSIKCTHCGHEYGFTITRKMVAIADLIKRT